MVNIEVATSLLEILSITRNTSDLLEILYVQVRQTLNERHGSRKSELTCVPHI